MLPALLILIPALLGPAPPGPDQESIETTSREVLADVPLDPLPEGGVAAGVVGVAERRRHPLHRPGRPADRSRTDQYLLLTLGLKF